MQQIMNILRCELKEYSVIRENENAFYLLEKATERGRKSLIFLLHSLMNFDQASEGRSQELLRVGQNKALFPKNYFL